MKELSFDVYAEILHLLDIQDGVALLNSVPTLYFERACWIMLLSHPRHVQTLACPLNTDLSTLDDLKLRHLGLRTASIAKNLASPRPRCKSSRKIMIGKDDRILELIQGAELLITYSRADKDPVSIKCWDLRKASLIGELSYSLGYTGVNPSPTSYLCSMSGKYYLPLLLAPDEADPHELVVLVVDYSSRESVGLSEFCRFSVSFKCQGHVEEFSLYRIHCTDTGIIIAALAGEETLHPGVGYTYVALSEAQSLKGVTEVELFPCSLPDGGPWDHQINDDDFDMKFITTPSMTCFLFTHHVHLEDGCNVGIGGILIHPEPPRLESSLLLKDLFTVDSSGFQNLFFFPNDDGGLDVHIDESVPPSKEFEWFMHSISSSMATKGPDVAVQHLTHVRERVEISTTCPYPEDPVDLQQTCSPYRPQKLVVFSTTGLPWFSRMPACLLSFDIDAGSCHHSTLEIPADVELRGLYSGDESYDSRRYDMDFRLGLPFFDWMKGRQPFFRTSQCLYALT